jgi:hypothetical protein
MEFLATKKWEERKKPSDLGSRRDGMGFKYLTSEREKDKKPAAPRRVACINESNRIELIAWASCLSFFLVIAYLLMVIFGGGVALNDSGDISAVIYTYLTVSGRVRANQFGRSLIINREFLDY